MSSVFVGKNLRFFGKVEKIFGRGGGGGLYTGGRGRGHGRNIIRGCGCVHTREARGGGKFCKDVGGGEKQVYILYISPIHS